MEKILSKTEAEDVLDLLTEKEKVEIERDKIRFGEYYIGTVNNKFFRLNPLNVISLDGTPTLIKPKPLTEI